MPSYTEAGGFKRDTDYIPDRITRDSPTWPVEPGRYRLVAAKACPWATRSIIVRQLLGLEDVISLGLCGPTHDERSWTFDLDPGEVDPVLGIKRLQEAYLARFPDYDKGITVPAIVDVPTGQVVTNDFPWITHDLFFEWREYHRPDAPDLWPAAVREEMDQVMARLERAGAVHLRPRRVGQNPSGVHLARTDQWHRHRRPGCPDRSAHGRGKPVPHL